MEKFRDSLIGFVLGCVACWLIGLFCDKSGVELLPIESTDTIYHTDTVTKPLLSKVMVVRHDTLYVPIEIDSGVYVQDTVEIDIPIYQKIYEDSAYFLAVSGYDVNLDCLAIRQKTITHTRYVETKKSKKWGLGVGAGVSYCGQGVSPCVYVGVHYNILDW